MKYNFIPITLALSAILIVSRISADAQQVKKLPKIGFLSGSSAAAMSARTAAFQHGLRDLGYLEGKNILVEYRYGDGKIDRVPALAAELAHLNVDVIVVGGGNALLTATKQVIDSIPIV